MDDLYGKTISMLTQVEQASNQMFILVESMVDDRDRVFANEQDALDAVPGENMVTTRSGAMDGLTSNILLRWRMMVTTCCIQRNCQARNTAVGAYVCW